MRRVLLDEGVPNGVRRLLADFSVQSGSLCVPEAGERRFVLNDGRAQRMSDLYDTDILLWSERQSELLRRVAPGETVNDRIDWQNIAGEVEDVGRSSLRACRAQLLQALLHDLKAEAWPHSRDVPHWRSEARVARINAADAYAPSMRQKIDIADIYAKALRALSETMDGQPPLPLPEACPMTLDELIGDEPWTTRISLWEERSGAAAVSGAAPTSAGAQSSPFASTASP